MSLVTRAAPAWALCLLVSLLSVAAVCAQDVPVAPRTSAETPATDAAGTDPTSSDDEMNRVAGHFGMVITEAMVETMIFAKGSPMNAVPQQRHDCVKRVFKDELNKAQAQSLRTSLPKSSDVAAFERFVGTDGGRKLLAAFRLAMQDAMAGREQTMHFKDLEAGLSGREREEIERFMASPQGGIFREAPKIGQPVGGMEAFARRLSRECEVN